MNPYAPFLVVATLFLLMHARVCLRDLKRRRAFAKVIGGFQGQEGIPGSNAVLYFLYWSYSILAVGLGLAVAYNYGWLS